MGWWVFEPEKEYEDEMSSTSSPSSSSTRKSSHSGSEDEVQSAYSVKQETVLPISPMEQGLTYYKKGIREFYYGRSKSFAYLDLSSGEDIENMYNLRHKKGIHDGEVSKKLKTTSSKCESVCSNSNLSCINLDSRVSRNNVGYQRSRSCPNFSSQHGTLFI